MNAAKLWVFFGKRVDSPLERYRTQAEEMRLLKEHMEKNREYYENLRRCYDLDQSQLPSPLNGDRTK